MCCHRRTRNRLDCLFKRQLACTIATLIIINSLAVTSFHFSSPQFTSRYWAVERTSLRARLVRVRNPIDVTGGIRAEDLIDTAALALRLSAPIALPRAIVYFARVRRRATSVPYSVLYSYNTRVYGYALQYMVLYINIPKYTHI